jgi:soluble epoxide hydrolase/lipid-phosphate phosphatase
MSERLRGSFASSLCYYKLLVNGVAADDDKGQCLMILFDVHVSQCVGVPNIDIAPEAYVLHQPTFWATTPLDVVGIVATQKPRFEQFCKNATVKEYSDAGHWVLLSHGEQLAKDLQAWVEGL